MGGLFYVSFWRNGFSCYFCNVVLDFPQIRCSILYFDKRIFSNRQVRTFRNGQPRYDKLQYICRYHIGTLAFGSLIITICRLIRVMIEYIDHKLKKYDNGFVTAMMCCCKCFFWCLEKFLKFINKNAYIMCAIHGRNFCLSAKDAFNLLMRNLVRVFVVDKVRINFNYPSG